MLALYIQEPHQSSPRGLTKGAYDVTNDYLALFEDLPLIVELQTFSDHFADEGQLDARFWSFQNFGLE